MGSQEIFVGYGDCLSKRGYPLIAQPYVSSNLVKVASLMKLLSHRCHHKKKSPHFSWITKSSLTRPNNWWRWLFLILEVTSYIVNANSDAPESIPPATPIQPHQEPITTHLTFPYDIPFLTPEIPTTPQLSSKPNWTCTPPSTSLLSHQSYPPKSKSIRCTSERLKTNAYASPHSTLFWAPYTRKFTPNPLPTTLMFP